MIITLDNLRRGLEHRNEIFPKNYDVRNSIYNDIYEARAQGITRVWWKATVERLSKWGAIRSRTPGTTKESIYNLGIRQLSRIRQQYEKLISAEEPCIINSQWPDIQQLFDIASAIKQTKSPVFASKMCHFLFPKLFVVVDNKATGVGHYELFWRGLKDAWGAFEQKEEAKHILVSAIKNGQDIEVHQNYPVETTIMEICTIGYNNG